MKILKCGILVLTYPLWYRSVGHALYAVYVILKNVLNVIKISRQCKNATNLPTRTTSHNTSSSTVDTVVCQPPTHQFTRSHDDYCTTMLLLLTVLAILKTSFSIMTNITQDNVEGIFPYSFNELQILSELPLDKLIRLKNTISNEFGSTSTPETEVSASKVERVGDSKIAQRKSEAMALSGIPPRRSEHEYSGQVKNKDSKVNKVFTLSVTTLAFLAFGGYLLCLIVQAVKQKSNYVQNFGVPTQSTIVLSSLKKKPESLQYGRKRRDLEDTGILDVSGNSEHLYLALVSFCEGYAKWSGAVSEQ